MTDFHANTCSGCSLNEEGVKLSRWGAFNAYLCKVCRTRLSARTIAWTEKNAPAKADGQRVLVNLNPDARFLVRGYHTGDFLGAVAVHGLTGAEFVVERSFSPRTVQAGDRVWVPFANYVDFTIKRGEAA
jgi:hypothetical protein